MQSAMGFKSLLGLSSNQPLLPQYEHELDTIRSSFRSPSSAMASFANAHSVDNLTSVRAVDSPARLLAIQRTERHLQKQLQALLDAQSDGLFSGPGTESPGDAVAATGAFESPSAKRRPRETKRNRRPPAKVSLRGARSGILETMHELASVKDEELEVLQVRFEDYQVESHQMETWAGKKDGLEKQIRSIEDADAGRLLEKLEADEKVVQV